MLSSHGSFLKEFSIKSSLDLWKDETGFPSIPTFSRCLDDLLGNEGVQLGSITEIIGLPGAGKTQLCIQLCASVQVPCALGGLEAEALFIDTNTNFSMPRFLDILDASMKKCNSILGIEGDLDIRKYLKRFHYADAFGLEKFKDVLKQLPSFVNCRNLRLIVIDSITFPFKGGEMSERQRTGFLFSEMARLQRLAIDNRIAIVVTNEMSTRPGLSSGEVVGALGDAWAHRCNTRLLLSRGDSTQTTALLLKSHVAPRESATFMITGDGIRDVE